MTAPILTAENLVKTFGEGRTVVRAVDGVSMQVMPGELVTITGPSGSGKTTLVSMLGALLRPNSGKIVINGTDISSLSEAGVSALRARSVGFVFQSFNLLEALSVRENVLFPAYLVKGGIRAAEDRADELLARLGLSERSHALPRTLSGGESQRVAIARALINQPKLVIADEPTGNLDSKSGQEVLMILHDIARDEGRSVVLVTHDQRVEEVADRILWLEDGNLRDRKQETREWVYDPVCNMRVDGWTSTIFVDVSGIRYHFCSERCRQRFTAEPNRYIQQSKPEDEI
ncbi:MAG: ATP-binding cassette domain-containing protein [Paracoccaceae bacterium]